MPAGSSGWRAARAWPVLATGLALLAGCGTATPAGGAPDSTASAAPAAEPASTRTTIELPPSFGETMEGMGYVLEDAGASSPATSPGEAIRSAQSRYRLFESDDPALARLFLVSTPQGGELENPGDPSSEVIRPTLDRTLMWVVYVRAQMLKDDHKPERGFVRGTVVVFVDAVSGEPQQAITY